MKKPKRRVRKRKPRSESIPQHVTQAERLRGINEKAKAYKRSNRVVQ